MASAALAPLGAHAELNDFQRDLAVSCGKTDAGLAQSAPEFFTESWVRKGLITQASMFGLSTKEDILEFIKLGVAAYRDQTAVLRSLDQ